MPEETTVDETKTIKPGSSPAHTAAPTVTIAVEDYQRFRGIEKQLLDFQTEKAKELDAKEQERLKALADAGKAEQALGEQKKSWEAKLAEATTKHAELERSIFDKEKTGVLASALTGRTFAGETAEDQAETARQLRSILEPQFETSRDSAGNLVVRERASGRPAADVLKEAIASKRFAHFFAPSSRGGSGTDGTRSAADTTNQQKTYSQQIIEKFQGGGGQYQAVGLGGNSIGRLK